MDRGGGLARRDPRLPLVCAGLVLLVLSHVFPIAELDAQGVMARATLWECIRRTSAGPTTPSALIMIATTMLFPLLEMMNMLFLLLRSRWRRAATPGRLPHMMRLLDALRPWGMIQLYMLGMLVSISKMNTIGVVMPGIALVAMGLLTVVLAALLAFDFSDLGK